MKIAIVDDDPRALAQMRTLLGELLSSAGEITEYGSGTELLREWSAGSFDLIILDIFMGEPTGMETARRIRETDREVRIVFCTSSNEFASESYEVDACYYLHKPIDRERVRAMLDRLNLSELERLRTVTLPDGGSVVLRSIIYADCASHRVTLRCRRGETVTVRASFSELEALLRGYPYLYSPCKGVIVNFYEIKSQSTDTFTLSDGSIIPISRRRAKDVLEAYSAFRFELLRKGGDI